MNPKVYVETTIVSYLSAAPSRDIVLAAHQQLTREWWARRQCFDLFVSRPVWDEASRGDAEAAAKRLAALDGIPVLLVSNEGLEFADRLLATTILPVKAATDALHVAIAVLSGMDYLHGTVRTSPMRRFVAGSSRPVEPRVSKHRSFVRPKN